MEHVRETCLVGWEHEGVGLISWMAEKGERITEKQKEQVREYCSTLYYWSGRMSLVSRADRKKVATKHILPSLGLGGIVAAVPHKVVLDIGSGGGVPGIPLKILFPESIFVLVESRRKRANFLKEVIRRLELDLIEVVNSRVEKIDNRFHGYADVVVSRATTDTEELMRWSAPVLKPYGMLLTTLDKARGYRKSRGMIIRIEKRWEGQLNCFGGVR